MSPYTEPSSPGTGTSLTPAEILAAIVPALIGMAAVAFIAMLMWL